MTHIFVIQSSLAAGASDAHVRLYSLGSTKPLPGMILLWLMLNATFESAAGFKFKWWMLLEACLVIHAYVSPGAGIGLGMESAVDVVEIFLEYVDVMDQWRIFIGRHK